jgi:hypothetical protein
MAEYHDLVCGVCGGYGWMVQPHEGQRMKVPCADCLGIGHLLQSVEEWSEWKPDPETLAFLGGMPALER